MEGDISISGEHRGKRANHFRDRTKMLSTTRRFKRILRCQGRFYKASPQNAPETAHSAQNRHPTHERTCVYAQKRGANEPPPAPAPQILWEKIKNMVMRAEQPESGVYII